MSKKTEVFDALLLGLTFLAMLSSIYTIFMYAS